MKQNVPVTNGCFHHTQGRPSAARLGQHIYVLSRYYVARQSCAFVLDTGLTLVPEGIVSLEKLFVHLASRLNLAHTL